MRIGTFLPGLDLDTARFECRLPETIVSAAERTDKRTASKAGPGACLAARGRNRGRSIRALLAPWIVAVTVLFTASADEAAAHTGAGAGANDPVSIPDANLRARVEAALGKASGETITHAEMAGLTTCRRTNMPGCLNTQGAYADRNNPARAITDLRGLDHATGLTRLVLSNNPVRNLAPIAGLTSLTELTLARGRVSDLMPIAGLTNLERLHLSNNQIDSSQLRHLTGLSSLKRLSLSGNLITSLTSLSGLTGLTHLSLYRNQITSLTSLSGLTNLIDLLLDYNDITDIEPLRRMTALSLLRLEGNRRLRDISPLSGLTSLSRLDLDVTGIVDIQPLVDNPGLASGDTIDLRDTPHLNAAAAGHAVTLRERGIRVFTNENRWVQNVRVASGVRQLKVTWDSLTDYNPQGYKVQWRSGDQDYSDTASPARHHIVSGAGTTSYTIPDLIPGTEYWVRIRADNGDDYGGPPSAEAKGTPRAPPSPPPPGQVTGVTVTPGVESLIVSWTAVTDANGYKVQWKSGGQDYDATTRQGRVSGADTTSDTIPGLIPGTEYTVRVIATKAGSADAPPSDEATGTPLAPPPGQVAGVTVTPGVESLIVSWTAVTDANGYKVQWKSGGQDYDATTRQGRVSGADTTSDTIPGLIPDTEYTVRVIATKAGSADSPPSAEATGTPLALVLEPPPPGQVAGVTVTPGVESLIVSWTAVTDANGYKVQWKSGGQDYDATTRQGRVSGADTTSDTIPGLIPGTEYTVRVIATKAGSADGTPSAEATGTPLAPPPGQVTGVTVTPGVESLIVSWTAVTDANGYKVQWKSGGQDYDATTRQGRVSGADTTSYTIPGLIPGTEYTVRVIATKAGSADGTPSDEGTGAPARRVTVSIARNAAAVEGAAVEFPIRLDGPSMVMVTLTWATEGGTAQPGEDFHAVATGSLTLRPGDRAGTLRVRTLDDRRVEPAETFRVRLTGATNADVDPRAASRTGTITDNDTETARRRALSMVLAGMGRRIAADTVDAVEERFNRPPAGAQVILGGRPLTEAVTGAGTGLVRGVRDADRPGLEPLGATGRPAGYEHGPRDDGFDRGSPAEANEWMTWTPGEGFRRASALELLSRSRFDLSPGRQDDTGAADWSLWGRGTAGRFEGKPETGFGMDGEVFGGYVGLDYRLDRDVLLGVAVAHTRGDADYEIDAVTAGVVDLELTSVSPYAHWKPGPDLGVWALLGTGQGEVELKDEAGRVETDLEMLTVAFGLRQEVVTWQGIDVAFKADTFLTELETAAARELPEATGKARRLRLRLEGRTQWEISDVSQMTPSLEIGGRWDGGDAETGLGMEVAGGLAYTHTRLGLEVEAQGRFLLAHRKTAFDEYGGSLTVKLDPGQAGRGLWLAFAPGWGAEGSRVTQIWDGTEVLPSDRSGDDTPGLSPDRLDLDAGYGVVTHGGAGRLTPYAGLSIAGAHAAAKLGVRQEVGDRMELSVEGRRSMRAETGHEVMLYGRLRW